jgi:maltose/moltooligosaccharide transporter
VGILFGVYNGVSAIIALSLPKMAKKLGRRTTHALALTLGGISFISFLFFTDPVYLIIPMIGIGIAWGSILSMPYAMLANSIPPKQMGVFMGLFNMSITIPQIINGVFGGFILTFAFQGDPIYSIVMAGVLMILGAVSTFFVQDKLDEKMMK